MLADDIAKPESIGSSDGMGIITLGVNEVKILLNGL